MCDEADTLPIGDVRNACEEHENVRFAGRQARKSITLILDATDTDDDDNDDMPPRNGETDYDDSSSDSEADDSDCDDSDGDEVVDRCDQRTADVPDATAKYLAACDAAKRAAAAPRRRPHRSELNADPDSGADFVPHIPKDPPAPALDTVFEEFKRMGAWSTLKTAWGRVGHLAWRALPAGFFDSAGISSAVLKNGSAHPENTYRCDERTLAPQSTLRTIPNIPNSARTHTSLPSAAMHTHTTCTCALPRSRHRALPTAAVHTAVR